MLTFEERVLCGNSLQRFNSGLEPDPEPTREFGLFGNTRKYIQPVTEFISVVTLSQLRYLYQDVDIRCPIMT
jgi:hypothetical protein